MSEEKDTLSGFEPARGASETPSTPAQPLEDEQKSYLPLIVIASLGVLALVLLFAPLGKSPKPVAIEEAVVATETDLAPDEVDESAESTSEPEPTETASPWAESQQLNARRQSQEVLSNLLKAQQELESLRVAEWSPEALSEILTIAEQGDRLYQERNYEEAIQLYENALASAETVLANAPAAAADFVDAGRESLADNLIDQALRELSLAMLLDPSLDSAKRLYDQAAVREEVLALESSADRNLRDELLESAKQDLLKIRQLDSDYREIDQRLSSVDQLIEERDFRAAMSLGYSNLTAGDLVQAEDSFQTAQQIRPNDAVVEQALQQVEAARINTQRQGALDRAVALEASENWSEALSLYESLLEEDSTLSSAQLGKLRSSARAALNTQIEDILDDPLKLQSETTWQNANKVLTDARNVIDRGALLSDQIEQLDTVIRRARTPVTLALFSDSQTSVEIYRMGELGQFREHAVALFPGKYVLVGKRSGYRDVREDLVLDGFESRVELNIQCTEAI